MKLFALTAVTFLFSASANATSCDLRFDKDNKTVSTSKVELISLGDNHLEKGVVSFENFELEIIGMIAGKVIAISAEDLLQKQSTSVMAALSNELSTDGASASVILTREPKRHTENGGTSFSNSGSLFITCKK